jgi:hypothetical protein
MTKSTRRYNRLRAHSQLRQIIIAKTNNNTLHWTNATNLSYYLVSLLWYIRLALFLFDAATSPVLSIFQPAWPPFCTSIGVDSLVAITRYIGSLRRHRTSSYILKLGLYPQWFQKKSEGSVTSLRYQSWSSTCAESIQNCARSKSITVLLALLIIVYRQGSRSFF